MPEKRFEHIGFPTLLLALSIVSVWGFAFVAINLSLKHVNPGQLVVLRFVPAFFVFFPYVIVKWSKLYKILGIKGLFYMFVLGLFAVAGYNIALNTGQTYLPASLASLVVALNPAGIALISAFLIKEYPSSRTWSGLFLGLAGIALVILNSSDDHSILWVHFLGAVITLGAPISWGFYSAGIRYYSSRITALESTALSISLGTIPFLFYPLFDNKLISQVKAGGAELLISVLFLSLMCTVYGFTAFSALLKKLEAAKAGMFIYLVPLVAVSSSHFILREKISISLLVGGIMVLSGVWLSNGKRISLHKGNIFKITRNT